MPKKQPIGPSDVDNMVNAAREMAGALVSMSDNLQAVETHPDLDALTMRESASALIACARDANHTAVMLLSHARRIETARQLAALKGGKKD